MSPVCGKAEGPAEFRSWAGVARRASKRLRRRRTEDWRTLRWKSIQRNVRRLEQRIYQAERRGDRKCVHSLQRLLLRSWSSRCLAVRQVTQENRGKRTAGVDGKASLKPGQRLKLAKKLKNLSDWKAAPIRRKRIPKPGSKEWRKLGIPVMADRAMQALIKQALEPEWEAKFEPNSYGFRPGRSAHDAIEAIFNAVCLKPKYVLDTDIEKCFDRISHEALLLKLNAIRPIRWVGQSVAKGRHRRRGRDNFPRRRRTARGCDLTIVVQRGAARPGKSNQPGCATETQGDRDPLCG